MAKRKCSDMAQLLYGMLTDAAKMEDVHTFDDAFVVINNLAPEVTYQGLADAIVEYSEANRRNVDDLKKELMAIRRDPITQKSTQKRIDELIDFIENGIEPERKAKERLPFTGLTELRGIRDDLNRTIAETKAKKGRLDKADKRVAELSKHLEDGTLPAKKTKKEVELELVDLKKSIANLNKWVATSVPAMQKKMQARLDAINKAIMEGKDRVGDKARTGELQKELQGLADDIKAANQVLQERRIETKLLDDIRDLQKQLDEGIVSDPKKQEREPYNAITELKAIKEDIQRDIKKSDPAVAKRLDKTIEELDRRIKEGDIFPKIKAEIVESPLIEAKRDEIRKRQTFIRQMQQELKPKSLWARTGRRFWDTVRNFFSTGEFSYILRQGGIFAAAHPIKTLAFQTKHLAAVFSEKNFSKIMSDIHTGERSAEQRRNGVAISSIEGEYESTIIEEQIMGNALEGIPVLGKVFRAFDRGAVVYLSMVRAEWYNTIVESGTIGGNATKQEGKAIANFVNSASGRANLGVAESSARILADYIYSPRYALSRLQMAIGWHVWTSPTRVRKAIAIEYARMMLSVAAALGLAEMLRRAVDDEDKFDIEWDPRSSDFTKLRFGNRRVDFLAGINQVAVLAARIASGKMKSSTTGKITAIRGENVPYGGKYASDIITDFIKYKASPMARNFMNTIDQKTFDGPLTWQKVLEDTTLPITIRDIFEAFQEEGINASVGVSLMSFFGTGLNTYGSDDERLIADKYLEDMGFDLQLEDLPTIKEAVGLD